MATSWSRASAIPIDAPDFFVAGFPADVWMGKLFAGRGQFNEQYHCPCQNGGELVRIVVFDAPCNPGGFEERLAAVVEEFRCCTHMSHAAVQNICKKSSSESRRWVVRD
jgi:hypothetical protein